VDTPEGHVAQHAQLDGDDGEGHPEGADGVGDEDHGHADHDDGRDDDTLDGVGQHLQELDNSSCVNNLVPSGRTFILYR
jgi:hypothetical protein